MGAGRTNPICLELRSAIWPHVTVGFRLQKWADLKRKACNLETEKYPGDNDKYRGNIEITVGEFSMCMYVVQSTCGVGVLVLVQNYMPHKNAPKKYVKPNSGVVR